MAYRITFIWTFIIGRPHRIYIKQYQRCIYAATINNNIVHFVSLVLSARQQYGGCGAAPAGRGARTGQAWPTIGPCSGGAGPLANPRAWQNALSFAPCRRPLHSLPDSRPKTFGRRFETVSCLACRRIAQRSSSDRVSARDRAEPRASWTLVRFPSCHDFIVAPVNAPPHRPAVNEFNRFEHQTTTTP